LLEAFAATTGGEINTRKVATAGNADFFIGRPVGMPFGGHFRAVQNRLLGDFFRVAGAPGGEASWANTEKLARASNTLVLYFMGGHNRSNGALRPKYFHS
jgi:hypothetical protein